MAPRTADSVIAYGVSVADANPLTLAAWRQWVDHSVSVAGKGAQVGGLDEVVDLSDQLGCSALSPVAHAGGTCVAALLRYVLGDVARWFVPMGRAGVRVARRQMCAVRWYRLAAEQGHARAQNNLGIMYDTGEGVPQDDVEAARWYRLAADQGVAVAQGNLGSMYHNGRGVPQDYVAAHMWSNLAAAQSSGEDRDLWVKNRELSAARMTNEQLSEAQRLSREWAAGNFSPNPGASDGRTDPPPADRTPTSDADTTVIERVTAATCLVRVTAPAQ